MWASGSIHTSGANTEFPENPDFNLQCFLLRFTQSPGLALLSGRGFRDKDMIWWKQGSLRQGCNECLWSKVSLTVCRYLLALGIVEDCYYLADLLKLL